MSWTLSRIAMFTLCANIFVAGASAVLLATAAETGTGVWVPAWLLLASSWTTGMVLYRFRSSPQAELSETAAG